MGSPGYRHNSALHVSVLVRSILSVPRTNPPVPCTHTARFQSQELDYGSLFAPALVNPAATAKEGGGKDADALYVAAAMQATPAGYVESGKAAGQVRVVVTGLYGRRRTNR